jgi:uncharacterized protein YidB (DUF937 family)
MRRLFSALSKSKSETKPITEVELLNQSLEEMDRTHVGWDQDARVAACEAALKDGVKETVLKKVYGEAMVENAKLLSEANLVEDVALVEPVGATPSRFYGKTAARVVGGGMPSMTALLGLLAVAGYQNRDKLAEILKGAMLDSRPEQPGVSGLLGNLGGTLAGAGVGGLLSGGLGELLEKFTQNGQGETAKSWINDGPNKEISPPQLKQAIGSDFLATLEQQTGLSQEELLARLSRELPTAVDKYTHGGK